MDYLIAAIGSYGDLFPALAICRELQAAGHSSAIATSGNFRRDVEEAGFEFIEMMSSDEYNAVLSDADLWHPKRSVPLFIKRVILECMPRLYEIIAERDDGDLTVVGPMTAIGARIAREKLGTRLVTIHFAPFSMREAQTKLPALGWPLPSWLPNFAKRGLQGLEEALADRVYGKYVNEYRATLGLPAETGIFWQWWNSPDLILGLFPEWYAGDGIQWAQNTRFATFPRFDREEPMSDELTRFLADGTEPIVLTVGSAMAHGKQVISSTIEACSELDQRVVLVSKFDEQVPRKLSSKVLRVRYAPFSKLIPAARALVFNGGIGTASQAMAAGIPQLVIPFSTDQPDNANRLTRLGVANTIAPNQCSPEQVRELLQDLLQDSDISKATKAIQQRMQDEPSFAGVVSHLESVDSAQSGSTTAETLQTI